MGQHEFTEDPWLSLGRGFSVAKPEYRWAASAPRGPTSLGMSAIFNRKSFDVESLHSHDEAQKPEPRMFEQLLKLYTAYMISGVTSPMPHFVGPPGSGKSTVFQQLADLLGVKLHVVNVSRISPLGLEGLEMPDTTNERLRLLISEMWTKAKEGDIYLFDEFLRGFPEVYNGLLDIFTAREVAGYSLPRVFIAGASNSVVTYDGALEDRLLHIPVPDPRKRSKERKRLIKMFVETLGLHPIMTAADSAEDLFAREVLPTYALLDEFTRTAKRNAGAQIEGSSMRKLIGQVKLREVQSHPLQQLIEMNNMAAQNSRQFQYTILLDHRATKEYRSWAENVDPGALTPIQRENLTINLQLMQMEDAKKGQADDD